MQQISEVPVPETASKLLAEQTFLHTGCGSLDLLLQGGFVTKSIAEICGSSSSGKTQLCFQLCCMVQLPVDMGGLNGAACYITHEYNVQTERIKDIEHYITSKQDYSSLTLIFSFIFFHFFCLS